MTKSRVFCFPSDANQGAIDANQGAGADHEWVDQIMAEQGINKVPNMDAMAGVLENDRSN